MYGHHPKPVKCILVVKPERLAHAMKVFRGSEVQVHTEGSKDTGGGSDKRGYSASGRSGGQHGVQAELHQAKIDMWISAVKKLAEVAVPEPPRCFCCLHALSAGSVDLSLPHHVRLCRALPLEDTIRSELIRTLLKRDVNDHERDMFSLPARMGGMGIFKPTEECLISSTNSQYISAPSCG